MHHGQNIDSTGWWEFRVISSSIQLWSWPTPSNSQDHLIIGYTELEGTRKDHQVQLHIGLFSREQSHTNLAIWRMIFCYIVGHFKNGKFVKNSLWSKPASFQIWVARWNFFLEQMHITGSHYFSLMTEVINWALHNLPAKGQQYRELSHPYTDTWMLKECPAESWDPFLARCLLLPNTAHGTGHSLRACVSFVVSSEWPGSSRTSCMN